MVAVVLGLWPWAPSPFFGPKWMVVGVAAATSLVLLPRAGSRFGWVAFAALASLGASATSLVLNEGASPWWTLAGPVLVACWALAGTPLPTRALAGAAAVTSAVVTLQAFGLDPFAALAPEANGARLLLYGTLGNPDFVASVLGVTAPLTVLAAPSGRGPAARLCLGSSVLQLLALALVRSFATVLSLGAAAVVILAASGRGGVVAPGAIGRWKLGLGLGAALLVVSMPLAGRSLSSALEGRRYLGRIAAPHVADAPWFGQGPGAVALHWPRWELEHWRARCGLAPACVAASPQGRFTGLQDHVHNDWLERLLESGYVGLVSLLALFVATFVAALQRRSHEGVGVAAALASLAARAAVDFPLARPADLVLLAVLVGAAARCPVRREIWWTQPGRARESPSDTGGVR